ncbi:alpha/beta fold hydrolase [Zavarzinia compransoris]|uniref:2-hydroxy-6-oxo-2,4-heptadienoate hydrolase n=1 Tax=Zavarzinia compransoris TaxID=1264899 RepID=A0A317DTF8_9PROT|nr:alpha/beta fold hydrolase [Zavarzinia compransoris]PWR17959.1 2-hydroxy-6-oxo-2,4-heptadienoate hydrolase [Zavarzinia compransoris]TDP40067.1 2-hydroxymuconate semialdehyde hydrolase [Zavarzinia compransoris]
METNPEIGRRIVAGGIATNYHDLGQGQPLLLIHGSGPGVSAYANWRLTMAPLSARRRVLAPDILGFGYTESPPGLEFSLDRAVGHLTAFIDALDLGPVDIVGNSFGGALALALTVRAPERVRRLVLMGAAGIEFPLTDGLDRVWGYEPSLENMRQLIGIFSFDAARATDDLVRLRYEASIRPGFQERFSALFPAPRQRWVSALATPEHAIAAIDKPALVLHGREDRVIPPSNAERLFRLLPRAELHMFGRCGHWTQIEHAARFNALVDDFLAGEP